MNVTVVGTGYVGLVTGACLASLGHSVVCVDIDESKIERLKRGEIPFYEPDLAEIVKDSIESERLSFTLSLREVMKDSEVVFIAVGTPPQPNGASDLQYVYAVAEEIGNTISKYTVIINKSTVPVGTVAEVARIISKSYNGDFDVVSNPEFLREGSAVKDFMEPDRIVVGTDSMKAQKIVKQLYSSIDTNFLMVDSATAEMTKYASNAFLATKISFINEIANVCEEVGADVTKVAEGMGMDPRIGKSFLNAGIGYGGSCFPKDVRALRFIAKDNNYDFKLLRSVIEVNNDQKWRFYSKIKETLTSLKGKKLAVWGLTFKPNTDDMREAVSVEVIKKLEQEGAVVSAYDPEGMEFARNLLSKSVTLTKDKYSCLENADALIIFTEWNEFKDVDWTKVLESMKSNYVFDGRNMYDPSDIKSNGINYFSIGR
ncbi:UDP-glucose/GDP-mannose dehydrogenase family protein [Candidatus Dojkabacteria bacterium]|uniref:UDP-glucose 6-dehydrogenase n=1 Tax=Candidatus Dojkabacteria bacterium TaxID=2099670 RepID=A0A955L9Q1_9BACT|nr:UDP-glucose/GDP-mannose dehydrogenase family protein [Candidatus Dojkabacteria bacterium]